MTKTKLKIEKDLYTYLYKWDVKKPKAVLNLIHGSKEHIGRYKPLIKYLNSQGISVYGMDLRGHGESSIEQDKHGHIDNFENIRFDIEKVNNIIKKDHPGKKIVIYGHSMGSFIVRYYSIFNKDYDYIFSGTNEQGALSTKAGLAITKVGKAIRGADKPHKLVDIFSYKLFDKQVGKGKSWLSNDPQVQIDYDNDPLNPKWFTNASFIAMLSWLKFIRKPKAYKDFKGNILIIAGTKDPVGRKGKGPKKVFTKYKKQKANVKIKLYKNGHHEIHNDKNKKQVWNDISNFILK